MSEYSTRQSALVAITAPLGPNVLPLDQVLEMEKQDLGPVLQAIAEGLEFGKSRQAVIGRAVI
jgi:hypothetical protein